MKFNESAFSFVYGGKPSAELLPAWKQKQATRALSNGRKETALTWSDPATGLEVRCVSVEYGDFDAVEWTLYFENKGGKETLVLEKIEALDLDFSREEGGEFVAHTNVGDNYTASSFQPVRKTLDPKSDHRFAPVGGRPCNGAWPYFNLQKPDGGVFIAVGWPGQWATTFTRDAGRTVRVKAGQETFRAVLKPGETVRSPLIALVNWQGADLSDAHNLWRRWMLAHNLPRTADGELGRAQIVACSSHQFMEMTQATEENQKEFIDGYVDAGMPLDYWWMDAGWYPCAGQWTNTGTWEPDAKRFPNGLRAVSDHARKRGVKTIVWFEPERVGDPNSWLAQNHLDWILTPEPGAKYDGRHQGLLDLGNPEALQWAIKHFGDLIESQGIDLYRQDYNLDPLPAWTANDTPDRQGMTENLYVQGYLAYWDALRARFPMLRIDSCASGGRRDDLESMRRAVPLIRSDHMVEPTSQQNQQLEFSSWLPYHGAGYVIGKSALNFTTPNDVETYSYRSNVSPSLTLCYDMRSKVLNFKLAAQLFEELRLQGQHYFGDFYPLTEFDLTHKVWAAWQYGTKEEGFLQFFRRQEAEGAEKRFKLRGLEASAEYELSDRDEPGKTSVHKGSALTGEGLLVKIPEQPGARVIFYRRKK